MLEPRSNLEDPKQSEAVQVREPRTPAAARRARAYDRVLHVVPGPVTRHPGARARRVRRDDSGIMPIASWCREAQESEREKRSKIIHTKSLNEIKKSLNRV